MVKVKKDWLDVYLVVEEDGGFTVAEFYGHSMTEDYTTVGKTDTFEKALKMVKQHSEAEIIGIEEDDITW